MSFPDRYQELVDRLQRRPLPQGPVLLGDDEGQALLWDQGARRTLPWADAEKALLDLAPLLDHTLLRAGANRTEVETLCGEASLHRFASVCLNPEWVPLASRLLAGSFVRVCTVVGFPLGASRSNAKAFEARLAVAEGAHEVDMVLDLGATLSGDWGQVAEDMQRLREAVPSPTILKIILETCLLNREQKFQACRLAEKAGLDFVKTSTGFSTGGATETDVQWMRSTVGPQVGVKASGGIRTRAQAIAMIKAGATRLGVSASLAILGEAPPQSPSTY